MGKGDRWKEKCERFRKRETGEEKKVSDGEKSDTWTEREKSGKGRRNKETNGDGGIRRQVDEKGER